VRPLRKDEDASARCGAEPLGEKPCLYEEAINATQAWAIHNALTDRSLLPEFDMGAIDFIAGCLSGLAGVEGALVFEARYCFRRRLRQAIG
jgi:hypothetical protein